ADYGGASERCWSKYGNGVQLHVARFAGQPPPSDPRKINDGVACRVVQHAEPDEPAISKQHLWNRCYTVVDLPPTHGGRRSAANSNWSAGQLLAESRCRNSRGRVLSSSDVSQGIAGISDRRVCDWFCWSLFLDQTARA